MCNETSVRDARISILTMLSAGIIGVGFIIRNLQMDFVFRSGRRISRQDTRTAVNDPLGYGASPCSAILTVEKIFRQCVVLFGFLLFFVGFFWCVCLCFCLFVLLFFVFLGV